MLDQTTETQPIEERRRLRDYLFPIAFLGAAGIAMISWITAIAWTSWKLIALLF